MFFHTKASIEVKILSLFMFTTGLCKIHAKYHN